ncbi:hypothetical protein PO486_12470 [Atlantibacter hermannii]|nr:hypothetical protein [Atlantibacter hermannii]MCQ4969378.1 hypothetical protein [Enterobacteriaceae bacterium DFI.7.85]
MAEVIEAIKEFLKVANSINYQGIALISLLIALLALVKHRH